MKKFFLSMLAAFSFVTLPAGDRYNFNADWRLALGDLANGAAVKTDDAKWQQVTLPHAYNQHEAFSRVCGELSDTIMWYRKHFVLPPSAKDKKIFIEFEGARFGAHAFLNGHDLGWCENGVMAFGFDLTPYVNYEGDNVLAVWVDSDWKYKEHRPTTDENGNPVHSGFQWNDKNFYCNYGGLNKNVWLHVMEPVYQTLPLYTNLGTTGVYVYAQGFDLQRHGATICCESQVVNASAEAQTVQLRATVIDNEGEVVGKFVGDRCVIAPGDTVILRAQKRLYGLHFWSWGYGYLYTVKTKLSTGDEQTIRTGFRKTEFHDGMFRLNGRVLQLKGFAQRSTNEWPAVGISIPAWLSDYSNRQVLGCNGNFFRWMHVTPSKQDIESFDRLGLIMAMPAGDAEKDVTGRRWEQRCELMRDAIIYNRNNPSIIFYEGGNNVISDAHMADLRAIRDQYDPHGGRASGCRNMLYSEVAEYGGEMLYVNKSANKPMWQMEYNRDEGIRRYWDRWSYPYHEEGEGPLYRGDRTASYNHNQDGLAIENIVRWEEYWRARPGQGRRVNAGGAKIIFSDSNTHARGEKNYRTSGDVDPMRIPKDSWFVHRALWDGWVDTEREHTHIIGHWNYEAGDRDGHKVVKPVYVASTGDEVELFLNGRSLGIGQRSNTFLFTWPEVEWQAGTLRAVARKRGREVSSHEIVSADAPVRLRLRWVRLDTLTASSVVANADGADLLLAEVEAVDASGRRHPLAHDMVKFAVTGEAEYLGGCSGVVSDEEKRLNAAAKPSGEEGIISEGGHSHDTNGIGQHELMLEAGVSRVLLRTTRKAGKIKLTATATTVDGKRSRLKSATIEAHSVARPTRAGFYIDSIGQPIEANASAKLPLYLHRGETPIRASFRQHLTAVPVKIIEVAANEDTAARMVDDNEASDDRSYPFVSKWSSDGHLEHAWARFTLEHPAAIRQIAIRMDGFRTTSYPLQVLADGKLVWEGYTPKSLGDSYLDIAEPTLANVYEIRMIGPATVKEAFASMTELAAKQKVSTKASKSTTLSIYEIEFKE